MRGPIWTLRSGLYAKVAGTRQSGQTALLEDIAVPVENLAAVCEDLQQLFSEHNYPESIIFGHAKDGTFTSSSSKTSATKRAWIVTKNSPRTW
ncbi:D-lactate dehydrogenase [Cutibacterium acnes JCM 18916]|nr:D-lactate dehydrogenase [Cutibacterium acnes JCM 18916]